jgi:exodeoxyribonuclease VII small subunit
MAQTAKVAKSIAATGQPHIAQDAASVLSSPPSSYEAALTELEALVARMEEHALGLEESLVAYRRGTVLVTYCQQQLEAAEQQVRVLDGQVLNPGVLNPLRTHTSDAETNNGPTDEF